MASNFMVHLVLKESTEGYGVVFSLGLVCVIMFFRGKDVSAYVNTWWLPKLEHI